MESDVHTTKFLLVTKFIVPKITEDYDITTKFSSLLNIIQLSNLDCIRKNTESMSDSVQVRGKN